MRTGSTPDLEDQPGTRLEMIRGYVRVGWRREMDTCDRRAVEPLRCSFCWKLRLRKEYKLTV